MVSDVFVGREQILPGAGCDVTYHPEPGSVPPSLAHCVPSNVSVCVFCLSHRETLARQTFLSRMRKVFTSLCLLHLISLTHQSQSSRPAGQNSASSSFPVCPEGRGEEERKKVCSKVTECETVCEKEDCQTNYKYRKGLRPLTSICNPHLSLSLKFYTESSKYCCVWPEIPC